MRNWIYIPTPSKRGYAVKIIGSIESSYRAYTYRMKKQGKTWSMPGLTAMISLIETRMNGTLQASLASCLKHMTALPLLKEEFFAEVKVSLRSIMRKAPVRPSIGALPGRIYVDAPTSSPIGRFAKALTH